MNTYATVDDFQDLTGASGCDALILQMLIAVSRAVDAFCTGVGGKSDRRFWTETATRVIPSTGDGVQYIPDCLSLSALAMDADSDGTFTGEAWTEETDYVLLPERGYPKTRLFCLSAQDGNYSFGVGERYIQATGVWGYGDGVSASPWEDTGINVTLTAGGTTATLSAERTIEAGMTLMVESEQIWVSAVTSDGSKTATVTRAVNGTTAVAHDAASSSKALYPATVRLATLALCGREWRLVGNYGLEGKTIGDARYKMLSPANMIEHEWRYLASLKRGALI